MTKVVILGAGLTGLSTAWELIKKKIDVEIIEKETEVGGLARTFRKNSYKFDYGPHAILTKRKETYYKIKELIGDNFKNIGKKKVKIRFKKHYFDYPLKITDALLKLNIFTSIKCFIDYIYYNLKRKPLSEKSFEDWITNNFGKKLYQIFFQNYTYKVWGINPNKLDKTFASERIPKLNLLSLFKIFFKKEKTATKDPGFDKSNLYYPLKGIQQIPEALLKKIKGKSKINLNSKLKRIILKNNRVQYVIYEKNNKKIKIKCDYLVSTIPLLDLINNINPKPNKEIVETANQLSYRKVNFLFLVVNKKKVFNEQWIYYHGKDLLFYRIYETSAFSKNVMPSGKTGLCIEISESIKIEEKKKIFNTIVESLEKIKAIKKEDVEDYFFDKVDFGYPIYTIGYKERLGIINQTIREIENLISAGRQGMFRYLDMDHCIHLGDILATQIEKNKIDESVYNIVAEHSTSS